MWLRCGMGNISLCTSHQDKHYTAQVLIHHDGCAAQSEPTYMSVLESFSVVFFIRFFPVWVCCSCVKWRKHLYHRTQPCPDPHTSGTHTHTLTYKTEVMIINTLYTHVHILQHMKIHTAHSEYSHFQICVRVCVSRAPWNSCWCFLKRRETRHCWVCVDLTWPWEQIRLTSESLTSHAGKRSHSILHEHV